MKRDISDEIKKDWNEIQTGCEKPNKIFVNSKLGIASTTKPIIIEKGYFDISLLSKISNKKTFKTCIKNIYCLR